MPDKLFILLWRNWMPLYEYPAVYSSLEKYSMGGTCSQLLWHAKSLVEMGHGVQVLGVAREDVIEEGIDFVGASNRPEQERLVGSGRIVKPDIIFLEGAFSAAKFFKKVFPKSKIVHIGQNIDRYGARAAFKEQDSIDVYALVGVGQMADYCSRHPKLRHKFLLVRNIVPWDRIYSKMLPEPIENMIAWVGAWTKKGLRDWAKTMQKILSENPSYQWHLFGPVYGSHVGDKLPNYIFHWIDLPISRVSARNMPIEKLAGEISKARVILVSLGNECGPSSVLDAHAMGRPVLSGNDMVYKYSNPEGTGIRVTRAKERYEALSLLIRDAQLCDHLGRAGRDLIRSDYAEKNQKDDLRRLLNYLKVKDSLVGSAGYLSPSKWADQRSEWEDKLERKWIRAFKI